MHDRSGEDRKIVIIELDKDEERTFAEKDAAAIEEYNRQLEEQVLREKKLMRHYDWRGNKLPPFCIEPMPHERQRLAGAGMTDEDRALRRQWLKDQELSPNEPRYIPEVFPKNPFRRLYGAPWNYLFKKLKPFLGDYHTTNLRWSVPKYVTTFFAIYIVHYYFKYNMGIWEDKNGWRVMQTRPPLLHADKPPEFVHNDQGFRSRKRDFKTSTPSSC